MRCVDDDYIHYLEVGLYPQRSGQALYVSGSTLVPLRHHDRGISRALEDVLIGRRACLCV